ncbi:MAG: hypothetical protein CMJ01_03795 [Pelagibacteraceae bacterium]|nr:hypothetical protein [Pelagibacteraceae bacterium]|tara:strand:+ start:10701 stop:11540 length:840 start_codon:yes stop_codon:yes gene_type:complete
MKLKSFSKINLSLNIIKKLKKNNLHQIQSYFCLVNLFDDIFIKKIIGKKDDIIFKGPFSKRIKTGDNSIKKVLKILRNRKLINNYYSILINKRIPISAGMGGGTSNAFHLAKYFLGKKMTQTLINDFENKIGTDFRLFFNNQGFLKNLKKVQVFKKKHIFYFLIIYPKIRSSTKFAYSKVKDYSPNSKKNIKITNNKAKFINFLKNENNDLQFIIEKRHPIIKKLIIEIEKKKGCYFSRMTGSGSACFGVFKSLKYARISLKKIKTKYPSYWATVAKTI